MNVKLTPVTGIGFVVGVVVVAVGMFFLLDLVFGRHEPTSGEVVAILEKSSPKLVDVLKQRFPDAFDAIVESSLSAGKDGGDDEDIQLAFFAAAQNAADDYADYARRAPDPEMKAWLERVADSIDVIYKAGGSDLCQGFLENGNSALAKQDAHDDLLNAMDARSAALFDALAAARQSGLIAIAAPDDADWAKVDSEMRAADVPANYADVINKGDVSDPDYCPALSRLFRNLSEMQGDAGTRIRAEYLANSI